MGHYSKYVKRYLDVFGKKNVHIIIFNDFKNDTAEIYKKTLAFLGADIAFKPDFKIINPNKALRSEALQNFLINPPLIFQPLGKAVSNCTSLRSFIVKYLKRFNTRYEKRPPVDPELKIQLKAEFASEYDKLEKLLERDLSAWTNS